MTVTIVDRTPRCTYPGCDITLRLSRSIDTGLCCCHRPGAHEETDHYVDQLAEGSISFGLGFTHDLGPVCLTCNTREAHCARNETCCQDCTHRFGTGQRYQRRRRAS